MIELVRRDALDTVAVPNKTSLLNQPDNDPSHTGHKDIAGERNEQQKTHRTLLRRVNCIRWATASRGGMLSLPALLIGRCPEFSEAARAFFPFALNEGGPSGFAGRVPHGSNPCCKSAQLLFVVAIEAGKLLFDIRQNRRLRVRGQLRRRQHSIDCPGGKARCLMVRFEDGPGGASRKSKRSCLLVKCDEAACG